MKQLEEMIRQKGIGIGTDIVKVDSFLNHRIDVGLATAMGNAIYEAFKDQKVDLILTVEASGIAVALTTAQAFGNIPVVFAKKGDHVNVGNDVYAADVYSFTHKQMNSVRVSRSFLPEGSQILITYGGSDGKNSSYCKGSSPGIPHKQSPPIMDESDRDLV